MLLPTYLRKYICTYYHVRSIHFYFEHRIIYITLLLGIILIKTLLLTLYCIEELLDLQFNMQSNKHSLLCIVLSFECNCMLLTFCGR